MCLYFVYKAEFVKMPNHLVNRMEKLLQVSEGLGDIKSFYDEANYANYPSDELRMDFYVRMMKSMTKRGDYIFNIFGGAKPMFSTLVSNEYSFTVWVHRPKLFFAFCKCCFGHKLADCIFTVWVDRPKLFIASRNVDPFVEVLNSLFLFCFGLP